MPRPYLFDTDLPEVIIKTLRLNKKEDRRIRRGHPWVFSNEIEGKLTGIEPGDIVGVSDHAGRPVGTGYANPRSLIAVRILARHGEEIGRELVAERVRQARRMRELFYPGRDTYRAVFSESDLLPGLVVDRYSGWLSVQSLTAGIERMLPEVISALVEVYAPEGIVLRNDSRQRQLEGLPVEKKLAQGELPERLVVELAGLKFSVDLMGGQKTGFFLDQVDNYSLLDKVANGAEVLDLFCHTGAWSLYAAKAGARAVTGVDSSAHALGTAAVNAGLNGMTDRVGFVEDDAFKALKRLTAGGRTYGVVVSDPPSFIKSRAKLAEGLKGYRDINTKVIAAVRPGGFLVSCSCSHHMDRREFLEVLRSSASGAGRTVRLIEMRSQSKDHPVLVAAPETEYLKSALLQVL